MTKEEIFIQALKGNILPDAIPAVIQATVVKVDGATCSVELTENKLVLYDVLLNATEENEKGFILVPKQGTNVLVGLIGSDLNALYLAGIDEVEKVIVIIDNTKMVIDKDGIVINEGNNGGMCITPNLVTELNKNNQILQGILTVLNGAAIPEPGNGGPSALQVALKAAVTGKVVGSFNNIENTKMTH